MKFLTNNKPKEAINVAWDPGLEEWVSLNIDGSIDQAKQRGTAGGLLRDHTGKCLFAFSMNLGCCSITRVEMHGALEGLRRTWEAGFRKVVLQMDSLNAIALLSAEDESTHQHGMKTAQFRELCARDWRVEVCHTYREGNHAADYLASIGYDYPFESHTILISDCNLGYFLRYDCMGISEPYLV
ncbi:Putative ribonuclease H protein At1g65750 [Linum perenne]